jgi:hypothetical protein
VCLHTSVRTGAVKVSCKSSVPQTEEVMDAFSFTLNLFKRFLSYNASFYCSCPSQYSSEAMYRPVRFRREKEVFVDFRHKLENDDQVKNVNKLLLRSLLLSSA